MRLALATKSLSDWLMKARPTNESSSYPGLQESINPNALFLYKAKRTFLNMCPFIYPSFEIARKAIQKLSLDPSVDLLTLATLELMFTLS